MIEWPFDSNLDLVTALKVDTPLRLTCIDVKSAEIQNLVKWFTTVPPYTTVRVNVINRNVHQVIELIRNQLIEQARDRNTNDIPNIIQDEVLKDCIVIGPWPVDKELCPVNDKQYLEVIVDIHCGISVLRGANVFAPGVMGMTSDVKQGDLVSVFADISNKCLKGFSKRYNDPHKKFLGYGVVRMARKSLFEYGSQPAGIAVEMKETVSGVPSFQCPPEYGILQNYPSILCSHVLDPQNNEFILDMCASPGNKTTHIASLLNGKSHIIALDKTEKKIKRIKENCKNQGLNNVLTFVCNSINAIRKDNNTKTDILQGPPFRKDSFDRILLDAPCSALGQRPVLRHSASSIQHLNSYPNLQKRLFQTAVRLLKPSGILVYSTCTILVAENEGIVAWALKTFPELSLIPADPIIGLPGNVNCGLTSEQRNLVQKFGPFQSATSLPYQNESVGFFIAKFTKHQIR